MNLYELDGSTQLEFMTIQSNCTTGKRMFAKFKYMRMFDKLVVHGGLSGNSIQNDINAKLRRVYLFNLNANSLVDTDVDIYGIKNQVLIVTNNMVLIGLGYD